MDARREMIAAWCAVFASAILTLLFIVTVLVEHANADTLPTHRKVPVTFYCVAGTNPGALSFGECASLIRSVKAQLRQSARVQLLARKIEQIGEPAPHLITTPANGLAYLNYLQSIFAGSSPMRLKYVVAQPWYDAQGSSWLLGYTNSECSVAPAKIKNAVSFSNAANFNHLGLPRYWHSANAMIHELGHALGATHYPSGLMQADSLALVTNGFLPWREISLVEINYCLNRRR
jgi:hypothetical protein